MTKPDYLPLTIDVEQIIINSVGNGEWQLELQRENGDDLYIVMTMPDPLFDQLCEKDILEYDDEKGELVSTTDFPKDRKSKK